MAPVNAHGTRQLAKLRRLRQRDDREVSLAAIAPPRPCHSMAWSGSISIIYIVVNLLANKRVLTERVNRLCARCCTQHLTHTPTFPPLALTPHRHVFEKELERAHSSSVHSVSSELLLDKNCTSSSFVQFPFSHSLTTPVSWALFVICAPLVVKLLNNQKSGQEKITLDSSASLVTLWSVYSMIFTREEPVLVERNSREKQDA